MDSFVKEKAVWHPPRAVGFLAWMIAALAGLTVMLLLGGLFLLHSYFDFIGELRIKDVLPYAIILFGLISFAKRVLKRNGKPVL